MTLSRRSLLKGLPAAALAVALAVPAHAALDPMAAESTRHAYAAAVATANATTIPNAGCLALILRAQRDTGVIPLALSGGYPERPRHSNGTLVTREDQLWWAWYHRDRALLETLPDALACVWKRLQARPNNPDVQEAMAQLELAIHHLDHVFPALDYSDPLPQPLLPGQTVPAVVGPHGDYYDAIAQAQWMGHYARDLMAVGIVPLLAGEADQRKELRGILGTYRSIMRWQFDSAAKIAGLSSNGDRFCDVLYVGDTLTDAVGSPKPGLPEHYFALMLQLQQVLARDERERNLLQAFADLWRRTDDTMWGLFAFRNEPQRTRCGLSPLEAR